IPQLLIQYSCDTMSSASSSSSYFYIDDDGNEQGPFDFDSIISWISAGYFPPTLAIRSGGEETFLPLNEHSKFKEALKAQEDGGQKETDKEKEGESDRQAEEELGESVGKNESILNAVVDSVAAGALSSSSSSSSAQWYYIDDSGTTQGPYPALMMAAWLEAG